MTKSNDPSMDPDHLEMQVTAYLLGELSPKEASEVEARLKRDPQLRAWQEQLRQTLSVMDRVFPAPELRATSQSQATQTQEHEQADGSVSWRLSDERRQALSARFRNQTPAAQKTGDKIVRPRFSWSTWRWVVPVSLAAALVAFLGVTVVFRLENDRAQSMATVYETSPRNGGDRLELSKSKRDNRDLNFAAAADALPAQEGRAVDSLNRGGEAGETEALYENRFGTVESVRERAGQEPRRPLNRFYHFEDAKSEPVSGEAARSEAEAGKQVQYFAKVEQNTDFYDGEPSVSLNETLPRLNDELSFGSSAPMPEFQLRNIAPEAIRQRRLALGDQADKPADELAVGGRLDLFEAQPTAPEAAKGLPELQQNLFAESEATTAVADRFGWGMPAGRSSGVSVLNNQDARIDGLASEEAPVALTATANSPSPVPPPSLPPTSEPSPTSPGTPQPKPMAQASQPTVWSEPSVQALSESESRELGESIAESRRLSLAASGGSAGAVYGGQGVRLNSVSRRSREESLGINGPVGEEPRVITRSAQSRLSRESEDSLDELSVEKGFGDYGQTKTLSRGLRFDAMVKEQVEEKLSAPESTAALGIEFNQTGLADESNEVELLKDLDVVRPKKESATVGDDINSPAVLEQVEARPEADADFIPAQVSAPPPALPLPEVLTAENAFSTFSLNVSDVSFQLSAAALARGERVDPARVRSEEFVNAMSYADPAPTEGVPVAMAWDQAPHPFAHQRELVRISMQTGSSGRQLERPLQLVLLMDNSGSMERSDRVRILREALGVLSRQLTDRDRISVVTFARTPRLWVDALPGNETETLLRQVGALNPQGGTNLELALDLAYATARKHFRSGGNNRVILLTDGAANLGQVDPETLQAKVERHRREGIALDCFGVGWEGYRDEVLETLSRHGDGRYGFLNDPAMVAQEFADRLAGAWRVAAADVKAQVEFNPDRVRSWRQMGYEKHQLTKEQFRDNTVDAAEIGAAEAGTSLYVLDILEEGSGPLGVVRVRYKIPGTQQFREQQWMLPFRPSSPALQEADPAMRLAAVSGLFAEWLANSPYAAEVNLATLQQAMQGVPEFFPQDPAPRQLASMLSQARQVYRE